MSKGSLIVISAPSGGGKGTIIAELLKQNRNIKYSISATTRAPREGEVDKVHYHFISKEEFKDKIENKEMLEYAVYCDNYYGTPKAAVLEALEKGDDIILEIEVQGGAQIKEIMPECVSIFITPPSIEILEQRLRKRGTESEEKINMRIKTAKEELKSREDYDFVVINDTLEKAVEEVAAIINNQKIGGNKSC